VAELDYDTLAALARPLRGRRVAANLRAIRRAKEG
jgi:hypothetical protein